MTKPWYEALYEHFPDYDQEPYAQGTRGEVDFIEREIGHDRSRRILDVVKRAGVVSCVKTARRLSQLI